MKSKETICHEFGQRIKVLRKRRGLTQKDLADRVGVHVSFLGDVERGKKGCGIEVAIGIAEALNVRIGELFPEQDFSSEELDFIFWFQNNAGKSLKDIVRNIHRK